MASKRPPADDDDIDALVRGLIREYLVRKGYKRALTTFDAEAPRSASVASTIDLVRSLRLAPLYKKNKAQDKPLVSTLELLTHFFYSKDLGQDGAAAEPAAVEEQQPSDATSQAAAPAVPFRAKPFVPRLALGSLKPAEAAPQAPRLMATVEASRPPLPPRDPLDVEQEAAAAAAAADLEQMAAAAAAAAAAAGGGADAEEDEAGAREHQSSHTPQHVVLAPPMPPQPPTVASSSASAAAPSDPAVHSDANQSGLPPQPPITTSTRSAPAPAPTDGGGFWARLNAAKQQAQAATQPPAMQPPQPPPPQPHATAPVSAAPAPAPSDGGGFWARLNAAKQAQASAPAPSTEPPAPPAAAAAPASAGGGGGFWARLQAKKAAEQAALSSGTSSASSSAPPEPLFVAPDGKGFSDRSEYRRYMFLNYYTLVDKEDETLVKRPGEIQGQAFNLQRLRRCEVRLLDHCDAMHVEDLVDCKVFIAASSDSVFVRRCTGCIFYMACKQLRTRNCSDCTFFLYSKTDPIIETSTRMRFAPFLAASPQLPELFRQASLDATHNHWKQVFDFNKGETTTPEPHWLLLDKDEYKSWTIEEPGLGEPVNPVPIDAAPASAPAAAASSSSGASSSVMMAFDIRSTSQAQAEAAIAAQMQQNSGAQSNS